MSKNHFGAHNQWKSRPAHERFYDVADVIPGLEKEHRYERFGLVPMDGIKVLSDNEDDGGLYLEYPGLKKPAELNHWSFTGLCKQLGISTSDIRQFPARLVAPLIQHGLEHAKGSEDTGDDVDDETLNAAMSDLFDDAVATGKRDMQARQLGIMVAPNHIDPSRAYIKSVTSSEYGRYSNLQLANDAKLAIERGWRTPRAMATGHNPFTGDHIQADRIATVEDEMKCSLVKAGMKIGPAGVYLGDRNMFIFLASDIEVLPGHFRFVTLENSDVGENRALKATFGLMNYVCMNHILWGVTNVHAVNKKHRRGSVGEFHKEFADSLELVARSEPVPLPLYNLAKSTEIGSNKEDVVKALYARRKPVLTQRVAERAWDAAVSNPNDADGAAPNTYFGIVQGLSRYSQTVKHADTRWEIDKCAGELLDELQIEDASVSKSVGVTIESDIVVSSAPAKKTRKAK